jgi:hypothetical protein
LARTSQEETEKEERVDMKKVEMLQQVLVEHRWESPDSTNDINRSIIDLRREIQLGIMEIKGKMTIYLIIILLVMVVLARVLVLALRQL